MKNDSLHKRIKRQIIFPCIKDWIIGLSLILLSFYYFEGKWNLPSHAIVYGIITTILLPYLRLKEEILCKKETIAIGVNAGFLAIIIVLGERFFYIEDWQKCFPNNLSIILAISQTFCLGYVLFTIILKIFSIKIQKTRCEIQDGVFDLKKWGLIIISVKLLFFAAFFPCAFDFDAISGLRTFLDYNSSICDHHPFFVQIIHAAAFLFGKTTGCSYIGFAIVSLVLILLSTYILLYGIHISQKCGLSKKWITRIALFYAFFPLFPFLSVFITKDGFFAYAFLFYLFTLCELYLTTGECLQSRKFLWQHSISILFICLTRHQGLYIVVIEAIVLLFQYTKQRKTLFFASFLPVSIFILWSKCILPYFNVEPGGKQEIYGFFFQQTAYYLVKHPTDFTETESHAINNVIELQSMAENYKYYIQDPVKREYKFNPWYRPYFKGPSLFRHIDKNNENQALLSYMSSWAKMGLRHPLTYIEASSANILGFFYNCDRPLIVTEPYWSKNRSATNSQYQFFHINKLAEYYFQNINKWMKIPIVNWVLAIPYYIWIVIIMLSMLFCRTKSKEFSLFLPIVLSLCILVICPVAYGRYTYPIIVSIPFLFSYLISLNTRPKETR